MRNSVPFIFARFSSRSLLGVLTLSAVYFGGWEITKNQFLSDWLRDPDLRCSTPFPYLAIVDELDCGRYRYVRRGHMCCFGLRVPIPGAWEFTDRRPLVMGGVIPHVLIQEVEENKLGILAR